jgi:hypothetical protein
MMHEIPKKQFMGDNSLRQYVVPQGVTEIGDWAFAGCKNLVWVAIPESMERIGREAFASCAKLEAVYCYRETVEQKEEQVAELMALALRFFPETTEMIFPQKAGRHQWLCDWDKACRRFLDRPDEEGFRPFLAGGEEDYEDEEEKREEYCRAKRLIKANVILKRLLLEEEVEGCCLPEEENLYFKRKLQENDMALEVFRECVNKPALVVKIYEEAGILTQETYRKVLETLPKERVELRAILLQRTVGVGMDEWMI